MSKHTPGPWMIDKAGDIYAGEPSEGTRVDVMNYWGTDGANAHLIAAAPDLLEALEQAHREMTSHAVGTMPKHCYMCKAIAKAKGE